MIPHLMVESRPLHRDKRCWMSQVLDGVLLGERLHRCLPPFTDCERARERAIHRDVDRERARESTSELERTSERERERQQKPWTLPGIMQAVGTVPGS